MITIKNILDKLGSSETLIARALLALFALVAISYCVTLPYSGVDWYDNVVINEMARGGIVNKANAWSVVWTGNPAMDGQSWAIYYLGGLMTEGAYQLLGHLGPRAVLLVLFTLSAALIGFYAFKKTGKTWFALLLMLFYYVNPRVAYGIRGGRVDTLALFFILLSLALLQLRGRSEKRDAALSFAAGLFSACSVFSWITAAVAVPVVLWENGWKKLVWVVVGGLIGGLLLAAPFAVDLPGTLANLKATLDYNLVNSPVQGNGGFYGRELLKTLFIFPGLYALGFVLLFSSRKYAFLAVICSLFALVCSFSKIGSGRFLFLVPCMMVVVATSFGRWIGWRRTALVILVSGMTLVAFGRTVILRNGDDFKQRKRRDYTENLAALESTIGRNAAVYTDTFGCYYYGRDLGWQQWRVGSFAGLDYRSLLARCDWYVTGTCSIETLPERVVQENGFSFVKTIGDWGVYRKGAK